MEPAGHLLPTALESAGLPKIDQEYSVDHMSLQNSFALEQEEGGEYTMSMAYLLAWQGPGSGGRRSLWRSVFAGWTKALSSCPGDPDASGR